MPEVCQSLQVCDPVVYFIVVHCQKFSQYLKVGGDSSALVRILEKIEGHLRENRTRFMGGDSLTRADCYLLPSLQHIRVAGKVCLKWISVCCVFFIINYPRQQYYYYYYYLCQGSYAFIVVCLLAGLCKNYSTDIFLNKIQGKGHRSKR